MRYTAIIIAIFIFFTACEKNKFTSTPQITYKSVKPNSIIKLPLQPFPVLTIHITDAEGDLGIKPGSDTAFLFIKNLLTGKEDSLSFPELGTAAKSSFEADIDISIETVLEESNLPAPKVDTLFFEIYVKDFAKIKVIPLLPAIRYYLFRHR